MIMDNYTLKRKDENLLVFSSIKKDVLYCAVNKKTVDLLPLPLKRLCHYQEEFVETENEAFYELNEEGNWLVENWLSDREIPVNRDNLEKYLSRGKTAREWMLENHAFAFTDCYWIEKEGEAINWNDILKMQDDVDEFFAVKENENTNQEHYKGHNSTLGGELEKFWYKENGQLMLCKKTDKQNDILLIREIIASIIYQKQDYQNFCNYELVYNSESEIVGCRCKAFTNENIELITAYDLLEEYNMTQQDDLYQLIVKYANEYGLDEQQTKDYLDVQIMVDFLIGNRDRHQNNIAFLRDADTLRIICPAPIFDSGSSKHLEGKQPEKIGIMKVNSIFFTEQECLDHVQNFLLIDVRKLPTRNEMENLLNLSGSLSEVRKETLINLYEQKKNLLEKLQLK